MVRKVLGIALWGPNPDDIASEFHRHLTDGLAIDAKEKRYDRRRTATGDLLTADGGLTKSTSEARLSEKAIRTRRSLMVASTAGFFIGVLGLSPTGLPALGFKNFGDYGEGPWLPALAVAVIAYFGYSFWLYGRADVHSWAAAVDQSRRVYAAAAIAESAARLVAEATVDDPGVPQSTAFDATESERRVKGLVAVLRKRFRREANALADLDRLLPFVYAGVAVVGCAYRLYLCVC